jgi:hypothetical protein
MGTGRTECHGEGKCGEAWGDTWRVLAVAENRLAIVEVLLSLRGAHGAIAPIAPGSSACLGLGCRYRA